MPGQSCQLLYSEFQTKLETNVNLSTNLISPLLFHSFNLLLGLILLLAWKFFPFQRIKKDTALQHRFGIALVLLVCIWSMRTGVSSGLGIHFFMVTTLHLVFGWQLAITAVFLALLGMVWIGNEAWQGIGINAWVSGVVPILCTYGFWRIQKAYQLYNPFVFIFMVTFLGAIVSVIASGLLMTAIMWLGAAYTLHDIVQQFWIFVPLIALPEAVLNGMFIAGLIVFKPEWVALFDEKRHFQSED